uniref:Uncharacterized protein n=1 Tax=Arundo donax TaxID=35708 RepID=A0A0A9DJ73_ARUDO
MGSYRSRELVITILKPMMYKFFDYLGSHPEFCCQVL